MVYFKNRSYWTKWRSDLSQYTWRKWFPHMPEFISFVYFLSKVKWSVLERAGRPADRSSLRPAPHFQRFLNVGQVRCVWPGWTVRLLWRGDGVVVMRLKADRSLTVWSTEKRLSVWCHSPDPPSALFLSSRSRCLRRRQRYGFSWHCCRPNWTSSD